MSRLRSILTAIAYLLMAGPLLAQTPASAASVPAKQAATHDSLALARQYTRWFYQGEMDSLVEHWATMTPPPVPELRGRLTRLVSRAGQEVEVIEEKFVRRNGETQYWRTARFSDYTEPMLIRWVLDPEGFIGGMGMGPASAAPPIDPPGEPAPGPAKSSR